MPEDSRPAEIHISFHIRGFEDSPTVITNILGIKPTSVHARGERRGSKGGIYRENVWALDADSSQIEDVESGVRQLVKRLEIAKDKFVRLPQGSVLDLCCGISILDGPSGPPLTIDRHSTKFLGEIGASIDIDIYCLEND